MRVAALDTRHAIGVLLGTGHTQIRWGRAVPAWQHGPPEAELIWQLVDGQALLVGFPTLVERSMPTIDSAYPSARLNRDIYTPILLRHSDRIAARSVARSDALGRPARRLIGVRGFHVADPVAKGRKPNHTRNGLNATTVMLHVHTLVWNTHGACAASTGGGICRNGLDSDQGHRGHKDSK